MDSGVTGFWQPPNCHFPLTCCVALTTLNALPSDTVIITVRQLYEKLYLAEASDDLDAEVEKRWSGTDPGIKQGGADGERYKNAIIGGGL